MTFRTIINKVLIRLREETIASDWTGVLVDSDAVSDYQKLIGEFVNEAKREVEDAWNWTVLRNTVTLPMVSGTDTYTITGVNDRHRVLSIYRQTDGVMLRNVDSSWIKRQKYPTAETGSPIYYSTTGTTIQFYPEPDVVENIDLFLVDVSDDMSLAADTLTVNNNAVVLGALSRAISERGEDGGTQGDVATLNYTTTVSDLIAQDTGRVANELEWFSA